MDYNNYSQNSNLGTKNIIIIVLVIILFLSFLGINIFNIFSNLMQSFIVIVNPLLNGIYTFVVNILSIFGFSTGTLINAVSDTTDNVLNAVGTKLIDVSQKGLDINTSRYSINNPQPDDSNSVIQKSFSSSKNKWCLVGNDPKSGKGSCFELTENQQCLSNNIFSNKEMCINNKN
jgi:hypothetical protein